MFKHLGSSSSSITLITKISSSESINLCGAPTSPLELEWMFQKDRESTQNGLMAFLVPQCRRIVSRGKHLLKRTPASGDSKVETDFLGGFFRVSLLPCTGSLPGPWVLLCRPWRKSSSAPAWGSAPRTGGPASILVGSAGCLYLPQQLQSAGAGDGVGGWRTWIQLSCSSPAKAKALRAGVGQAKSSPRTCP